MGKEAGNQIDGDYPKHYRMTQERQKTITNVSESTKVMVSKKVKNKRMWPQDAQKLGKVMKKFLSFYSGKGCA